ncbi:CoA pyrophosphatase [Verticiella sediminum]|uniref:CoA pyrophosphatase n=1 Tax=Verticiella sediminum TaxID=1247510 RepID=A0A556A823_9BURK|nr:CoA pyrophosphatase [Verticiella sediminum]TSH89013.1 CoA pyrophosphatase [Verticiella sediminum]
MQRDERLRAQIRANLHSFTRLAAQGAEGRAAAVAVAVVDGGLGADLPDMPRLADWSGDAALLLTRRASGLRHHAGQWALPGGRVDEGETPEAAALRELDEEVGLALDRTDVLGLLDDYVTRSGFVITPVVLWAGAARGLCPNPAEVSSVHRIPVSEFMREDAPLLEGGPVRERPVLRMPVGEGWIAAPTAAVLYQFRELCIAGRPTRVAHFDQPAFAWR